MSATSQLGADERRELERLRAEVAALRTEQAAGVAAPARRRHPGRLRNVGATLVVILGCILAPLSVVSTWLATQVTDTDAYVQTVAPVIDNPGLQKAMADQITAAVFDALDVQGVTTQALTAVAGQTDLPAPLKAKVEGLAAPITSGVQGFLTTQVNTVVASPQFAQVWVEANRAAHQALVNLLTGKQGGAVQVSNGTVSVDLAPFIDLVKTRLVDRGITIAGQIPEIHKSFVIYQSDTLAQNVAAAQTAFSVLSTLGTALPIVTLVVLAAGVFLAPRHRRALVGVGLGVAASMIVLALAIMFVRSVYLGAVNPDVLPRGAAAAVFDTLVRFLRTGLRTVFVVAVIVTALAYLTGPSAAAVGLRRALASGTDRIRRLRGTPGGLAGERVGGPLATYRHVIRVVVVALAALVILLLDRPTPGAVLLVVVIAGLLLVIAEVFSNPPAQPAMAEASTGAAAGQAGATGAAEETGPTGGTASAEAAGPAEGTDGPPNAEGTDGPPRGGPDRSSTTPTRPPPSD
ncbi:hypothetical protein [Georgenia thermotolerans]|uniref:Integral membrane protein n=1 Tax=Georgenia thermotolerans TaxID=527326 RepID=A0A7J5UMN8_9MICO|nr:hypothetical protein [Georgenia thermotolerans]KAE8763648.1 hypothetical protein GB883_13085 [Georgenia thermotolerans]